MVEDRLKIWETLFRRALQVVDSTGGAIRDSDWTFGGGTVLMRRYCHRFSKDIDIFVSDPQYLGYLSPRLNDAVEAISPAYLEDAQFVKLYFPEGEVDFVVSGPLTDESAAPEQILGRTIRVESSIEIIAKKVRYRGNDFTARDIFDFALVIEKEPAQIAKIHPILADRREGILARIESADSALRKTFAALEVLEYRRTYDECVARVTEVLLQAAKTKE